MTIIVPEISRESFGAFEKRTSLKWGPKSYRESREYGRQNRCTQETSDKKHVQFQTQFHRAQNLTLAQTGEKTYPFNSSARTK